MGSSAVSAWTQSIKELQGLVDPVTYQQPELIGAGAAAVIGMRVQRLPETLPRATWKKLVPELKVPQTLSRLCVEAHQQDPGSDAALLTAMTLAAFLQKAVQDGTASDTTQLGAAVLQQLQRSELLQHLPAMMDAAAAELTAQATSEHVAAFETSDCSHPSNCYHHMICTQAVNLLSVLKSVLRLLPKSPGSFDAAMAALTAAAVELAMACLQHISSIQQQLLQQQQALPSHWVEGVEMSLRQIYITVMHTAGFMQHVGGLEQLLQQRVLRQQLLSPQLLSCLTAAITIGALQLTASNIFGSSSGSRSGTGTGGAGQDTSSSSGSSTRQGSSSSSSRGSRGGSSTRWTSAQSPGNRVSLQLTPSNLQLCDALGISRETVRWGARCVGGADPDHLQKLLAAYLGYINYCVHNVAALPSQLRLLVCKVDVLLPGVVLRWADSVPPSHPLVSLFRELAAQAAAFGFAACRLVAYTGSDYRQLLVQQLQRMQQGVRTVPTRSVGGIAHDIAQNTANQPVPPRELLAEVLPIVIKQCTARLQRLQQQGADGAPAAAAAGPNSNSSSAGGRGGRPVGRSAAGYYSAEAALTATYNQSTMLRNLLKGATIPTKYAGQHAAAGASAQQRFTLTYAEQLFTMTSADIFLQYGPSTVSIHEGVVRLAASNTAPVLFDPHTHLTCVGSLCAGDMNKGNHAGGLLVLARQAGPGSKLQRQVYSLLCCQLKAAGLAAARGQSTDATREVSVDVADAALSLLVGPSATAAAAAAKAAAAARGDDLEAEAPEFVGSLPEGGTRPGISVAAAPEAAAEVIKAAAAAADTAAVDLLPSLAIVGRCLLQLAQQQQLGRSADTISSALSADVLEAPALLYWCLLMQQWLQLSSVNAQLTAGGYDPQAVLQQLEQLAAAIRTLQGARSSSSSSSSNGSLGCEAQVDGAAAGLVQQLHAAGLGLCSLAAVPCMCNNPGCLNLSGLTELSLVSGHSCLCGGCRVARYCSRVCQRAHWKQHKPMCAALAAATCTEH